MPTAKRARQKAARQQKRVIKERQARRRRLGRRAAIGGALGAVVLVVALASAGVFSGSPTPTTTADKTHKTTTTTAAATATTTTGAATATTTTTAAAATTTTAAAATTTTTAPPVTTTTLSADVQAAQLAANTEATAAGCKATPKTRVNTLTWSKAPAMTITKKKTYTATFVTTAGNFTVALDAKTAPETVNNFVFLADQGYYKCVTFHRVIPGFMDQTGDPTGTGSGSPGYKFADENLPKSYATGDLAMANSGPNTNGSQFFIIATGGGPELGSSYSLFGHVTSGQTVVQLINSQGNPATNGHWPLVIQRILSITIHKS